MALLRDGCVTVCTEHLVNKDAWFAELVRQAKRDGLFLSPLEQGCSEYWFECETCAYLAVPGGALAVRAARWLSDDTFKATMRELAEAHLGETLKVARQRAGVF